MSIKVYHGWRWPRSIDTLRVCADIETAAKAHVRRELRRVVREMKLEDNRRARFELASYIGRAVQLGFITSRQDGLDPNYVFYVRAAGEHVLCMPDFQRKNYDFMKGVQDVEDYAYWDNTDEPEGMDHEEWKRRGQLWEKYWTGKEPCIQVSALSYLEPTLDIMDVICPDYMAPELPKGYWEDT